MVARARLLSLAVLLAGGLVAVGAAAAREQTNAGFSAKVFMKGMRVPTPGGWTVYEDHPGEFNVQAPRGRLAGTHIHFWLDPYAGGPNAVILRKVRRTPSGLVNWLRHNRYFVVSTPKLARIAGTVDATYVDVDLARTAPAEDPSCGKPCQTWFVFVGPSYNFPFGTGLGELTRVYFASIGRPAHTFVVAVDAPSHKTFAAVTPTATRIVSGLRLPKKICASRC